MPVHVLEDVCMHLTLTCIINFADGLQQEYALAEEEAAKAKAEAEKVCPSVLCTAYAFAFAKPSGLSK